MNCSGKAGTARHGKSGIGEIRSGEAGKEWRGAAEHGMVWHGEVRTGKAG